MAYERTSDAKVRGDGLDVFISNLSKSLTTQITIRNTEDELGFNKAVLEGNITLEAQLEYRKEQLKRVSDDPTERTRIKGEVSSLKQRIEQKKFSDAYLAKLVDFESGISSVDSVITWLEQQKADTTNQTVLDSINEQLRKNKAAKFELTKTIIQNQTEYAVKDKSVEVIDTQIDKVSSARTAALLSGNEALVSSYDLQLQSLKKAKVENEIEKDIKNFAVTSITGYASAVKLLDAYNSKVLSSSETSGPIKIGDITYASAKEFWTYKRDSYVSDTSGTGFFTQLNTELNNKVKVAASKNALDNSSLAQAVNEYDSLSSRPELAGYETRITTLKQDTLQTGVNLIGEKVINDYAVNLDVGKAVNKLSTLQNLGANTDAFYSKILTAAANTKSNQVNSILQAAQTALQNDPSLTPQQALDQAVRSGAGVVYSPEQLINKSETDIAGEFATNTGKYGNDPRTTVPKGQNPNQPGAGATPQGGGAFQNYTIQAGDTLSKIAARNRTTVDALVSLNNIQNRHFIQAGATLKIPTGAASTPAPQQQNTTSSTVGSPAPQPNNTSTTTSAIRQPAVQPNPAPVNNTPPPPKPTYSGGSIVDFLASTGQDSSFTTRSKLAAQKGIAGYRGTAAQNTQLLKALRGY